VIWNPIDYLRFMVQLGHVDVTGGPRAAAVDPTSTKPVNKRKYGDNTAAVRAQLEF
jgi:phosphate-selective porin OprO/OprP